MKKIFYYYYCLKNLEYLRKLNKQQQKRKKSRNSTRLGYLCIRKKNTDSLIDPRKTSSKEFT